MLLVSVNDSSSDDGSPGDTVQFGSSKGIMIFQGTLLNRARQTLTAGVAGSAEKGAQISRGHC